MLKAVDVGRQAIASYETSAGVEAVEQLRAAGLRGLRLLHLNATPYGGGVAEILRSEVLLLRDLGIEADWKVITGDASFFAATKAIHNGLQGARAGVTTDQKETWLTHSTRNAALLETCYDVIFVHDPQPLALRELHGGDHGRWVWRCHIDTSEPNPQVAVRPHRKCWPLPPPHERGSWGPRPFGRCGRASLAGEGCPLCSGHLQVAAMGAAAALCCAVRRGGVHDGAVRATGPAGDATGGDTTGD